MRRTGTEAEQERAALPKAPTGIQGLDEVTLGGLPKGRPTLLCGAAGCGKTLLAMEFLVHGAVEFDEPGVFMTFEETAEDLTQNVASLGFDLNAMIERGQLAVDYVRIERSEIEETGEFDLDALFIRLGHAIDTLGAKRVVIDTLEALFAGLSNEGILRAEIRRLFRWLKDKGMTCVITAERGQGTLTRNGLEEYVSDCVILLDHRVTEHVSTRRLRIVKYRGSSHATNEFPFLIDEDGISVVPITSAGLDHAAVEERISSGVPALDELIGGQGFYRGSSVLVSGTAGTGKTTLAAHFAAAACARRERSLLFCFEESRAQLVRNMRSVGLDVQSCIDQGLLRTYSSRPTGFDLEMHLAKMIRLIDDHAPEVVVVDPISNMAGAGSPHEATNMLIRLVDLLKTRGITALMTNLAQDDGQLHATEVGLSSIIDAWVLLREIEEDGERKGMIQVLKSRGLEHSKRRHRFTLTRDGISIGADS